MEYILIAEPDKISGEQRRKKHKMHPNSLKNLNKFRPGVSGNPRGAPANKMNLWTFVRKYADMPPKILKAMPLTNMTSVERTARGFVLEMVGGDWQRIKEALDRDDGRPTDRVEIEQETRVIIERV